MPDVSFDEFLSGFSPEVRAMTLRAREMVREVAPGVTETVWPGWKMIGYGTGSKMDDLVIGVAPLKREVSLRFARGTELPDPEGLMLDGDAKRMRGAKFRMVEEMDRPAVRALVEEAFRLHGSSPAAPDAKAGGGGKKAPSDESPSGAGKTSAAGYQVGGSKTVSVPVERLYAAWTDDALRERWLPAASFTVRKATPGKSLRITWGDESNLEVLFAAKGEAKSQVSVDQRKLPDDDAVERARAFWKERLAVLKEVLEGE